MTNEKAIWRKGSRFTKIDPDAAHAEMESIRLEKGQLTADLLLEKARDGSNVLHQLLNGEMAAAEKYRLGQARQMIKSISIVYEDVPVEETTVILAHRERRRGRASQILRPQRSSTCDPEMRQRWTGAIKS